MCWLRLPASYSHGAHPLSSDSRSRLHIREHLNGTSRKEYHPAAAHLLAVVLPLHGVQVVESGAQNIACLLLVDEQPYFAARDFLHPFVSPIVALRDAVLQSPGKPGVRCRRLRLHLCPAADAVPGDVEVGHRKGFAQPLKTRRLVSILSGVIIAGNDVPTAGLEKLRNQPFPVPSAPELLRLAKGGPRPHSRTTKPNFWNSCANLSGCGPM